MNLNQKKKAVKTVNIVLIRTFKKMPKKLIGKNSCRN